MKVSSYYFLGGYVKFTFTLCSSSPLKPLIAELNPIRHLLALVGATIFSTLAG
jgi:hypothetical protein